MSGQILGDKTGEKTHRHTKQYYRKLLGYFDLGKQTMFSNHPEHQSHMLQTLYLSIWLSWKFLKLNG